MNTDHAYIEKLIKRFFDGESTLEEEAELTSFFASDKVPSEWVQYKKVFQYLNTLQPEDNKRKNPWVGWLLRCGAAAAVIAIITVIGFKLLNTPQETVPIQPQIATADPTPATSPTPDTAVTIVQSQPAKLATPSPTLAQSKHRTKTKHAKARTVSTSADSAEIVHTEGELEKAEQEYIADRLLLEQELRRNQSSTTPRSGWITTSLNIQ